MFTKLQKLWHEICVYTDEPTLILKIELGKKWYIILTTNDASSLYKSLTALVRGEFGLNTYCQFQNEISEMDKKLLYE